MLKKQKNLISSKGCPPPSSKPPLRLPRTDGKVQRMIVAPLAQTSNIKSSSMFTLLSSYKSKKVEFLAIQAIHPTKKIRFFLVLQKRGEGTYLSKSSLFSPIFPSTGTSCAWKKFTFNICAWLLSFVLCLILMYSSKGMITRELERYGSMISHQYLLS